MTDNNNTEKEIIWEDNTRYRIWRRPDGVEVRRNRLCRARKKRSLEPCENWATRNGVCRVHGGKSLRGSASPVWKHGLYSKVLSAGVLKRYERFLENQGRECQEAQAILSVLISEQLERLQDESDAGAREQLRILLDISTRIAEREVRMRVLTHQHYSLDEVLVICAKTKMLIERFLPVEMKQAFQEAWEREIEPTQTIN